MFPIPKNLKSINIVNPRAVTTPRLPFPKIMEDAKRRAKNKIIKNNKTAKIFSGVKKKIINARNNQRKIVIVNVGKKFFLFLALSCLTSVCRLLFID